jgi:hypothetical protein
LFDGSLTPNEANVLLDLSLRILEKFRFQDEPSGICDGSNMSISVSANSQQMVAVYYNMRYLAEAGSEVKKIIETINFHLTNEKIK